VVVVVFKDVDAFITTAVTTAIVMITANIEAITIAFPVLDARKDVDLY